MSEKTTLHKETATPSIWKKHRTKLLIVLIVAQVLILTGIAISNYAIGWYGKEIRIETAPVDPRDPVYGDYVVLNYDISQIDMALWKETTAVPDEGKPVYVVLKPGTTTKIAGVYEAVGVYAKKPSIQDNEVILKGRIQYRFNDEQIRIRYGLETYYVQEATGKELEDQALVGQLVAKIKVAPWGRTVLEGLEMPK